MSNFILLQEADWLISDEVDLVRRQRLLSNLGYEKIVEKLAECAEIVEKKRTVYRQDKDFFRVEIVIRTDIEAIDNFYNSCCGYRAQFYDSSDKGIKANKYAVSKFLPVILANLEAQPKRTLPRTWLQKSLDDKEAKLWIYPGEWIRPFQNGGARRYRNLEVRRWNPETQRTDDVERKLSKLSKLMPDLENRLEIKGGWLNKECEPISEGQLSKNYVTRSQQLHDFGFTHGG